MTFFLLQLIPGDPAAMMLGIEATQEQIDNLRHELWLDRPLIAQYGHWLSNIFHGDLGTSLVKHEKVITLILQRAPITIYLASIALFLSAVLGVTAGSLSAVKRNSILDSLVSLFANLGVAIPVFWLGIVGVYIFGLKLGWLGIQGFIWPTEDFVRSMKLIVMPVICEAVLPLSVITRQTRSSMLEVIGQDYVRTARAKGLQERVVLIKHALRNALVPVASLLGLIVSVLIAGSILVETVFNIPGMGRLMVTAAFDKDFLVLQGGVLIIATWVCLVNLFVDIAYGWLDPRIRYG
jgi:peptide/nickel transport system permease protein